MYKTYEQIITIHNGTIVEATDPKFLGSVTEVEEGSELNELENGRYKTVVILDENDEYVADVVKEKLV